LPEGQSAKPLLMVHGWPGSFYEFYKIIPLLTDPASHGLSSEHVFEVICPSIPGYGFSEAPHKKGKMYKKKLNLQKSRLVARQPLLAGGNSRLFLISQRRSRDFTCHMERER